jgi:hypothetical protein
MDWTYYREGGRSEERDASKARHLNFNPAARLLPDPEFLRALQKYLVLVGTASEAGSVI